MKLITCTAILAILIPALSYAENNHPHERNHSPAGVEALSDNLRDLLSQEMRALQKGMMSIIPAYVSGDWEQIATTAGKIKRSFILKQQITKAQVQELHTTLPAAFIEKDRKFHYLAGMLEHAAKTKKTELINFYFSEMTQACVSCHSTFATHKFPNLSVTATKN